MPHHESFVPIPPTWEGGEEIEPQGRIRYTGNPEFCFSSRISLSKTTLPTDGSRKLPEWCYVGHKDRDVVVGSTASYQVSENEQIYVKIVHIDEVEKTYTLEELAPDGRAFTITHDEASTVLADIIQAEDFWETDMSYTDDLPDSELPDDEE